MLFVKYIDIDIIDKHKHIAWISSLIEILISVIREGIIMDLTRRKFNKNEKH